MMTDTMGHWAAADKVSQLRETARETCPGATVEVAGGVIRVAVPDGEYVGGNMAEAIEWLYTTARSQKKARQAEACRNPPGPRQYRTGPQIWAWLVEVNHAQGRTVSDIISPVLTVGQLEDYCGEGAFKRVAAWSRRKSTRGGNNAVVLAACDVTQDDGLYCQFRKPGEKVLPTDSVQVHYSHVG